MRRREMHKLFFLEKAEGKRTQGRTHRRQNNNNEMDLEERGWGVVDRIKFARGRYQRRDLVNADMNLRVMENVRKFVEWLGGCWILKKGLAICCLFCTNDLGNTLLVQNLIFYWP
jgi:hypothetical protein